MIAREDERSQEPTVDAVASLVQELRDTLKTSTILTPWSEGYEESIKRWSDGVEKKAVSAAKEEQGMC